MGRTCQTRRSGKVAVALSPLGSETGNEGTTTPVMAIVAQETAVRKTALEIEAESAGTAAGRAAVSGSAAVAQSPEAKTALV
mmetsp:Transcript_23425/g.61555  ORF Transcript_23425/g.61555 Transcript_23425/m.61555 type:complete len:82 (+) Transcript_23425:1408-1653(+)